MALLLQSGDALLLQAGDDLLLQLGAPEGTILLDGPLQPPEVLGSQLYGIVQLPGLMGSEQVLGTILFGHILLPSIFGTTYVTGTILFGHVLLPAILAGPDVLAYSDFTGGIPADAIIHYSMDLTTPGGLVRVPISSWQATLQVDRSNYVQCVVPAAAQWVDDLGTATLFSIVREAHFLGVSIEQEMAFAAPTLQFDRGPTRYTCTVSGYADGFAENLDPDALYDRTLSGIRSVSTYTSGTRVRCAIDWLLRPGQRAIVDDDTSFIVSYINYYSQVRESYMDVGERS